MFLAAIGHHYSFTIEPYTDVSCTPKSWKQAFYALLDFSDVGADIKEHLGVVGKLFYGANFLMVVFNLINSHNFLSRDIYNQTH